MNHLVELEQKAYEHVRADEPEKAAVLFAQIVAECPDWEHGEAFYSLACCYEDMNRLEEARHCFLEALKREPYMPYFLGGYASFLYLHGTSEEAYKAFLALLSVEYTNRFREEETSKTIANLRELAQKLGLSEDVLMQDIAEACRD